MAVAQGDPAANAAVRLLKLSFDQAKDNLVTASGDDMLQQQGVARHLQGLIRELTTMPPNIVPGAKEK